MTTRGAILGSAGFDAMTGAVLNILILIAGSIGSIAALTGETWRTERVPVFRKLTSSGWFALSSLLVALGLGAYKEILDGRDAAQQEAMSQKQQQEIARMDAAIVGFGPIVEKLKEACTLHASGTGSAGSSSAPAPPSGLHFLHVPQAQIERDFSALTQAIQQARRKPATGRTP